MISILKKLSVIFSFIICINISAEKIFQMQSPNSNDLKIIDEAKKKIEDKAGKAEFKDKVADQLARKYKVTKTKIQQSELFTKKVKSTLHRTNKKLMIIQIKKNKLNSEIQETKIKISELNSRIDSLEKEISFKKVNISKQIRALYKLSNRNQLMYILKSKSVDEFEKNKKYLKIMTDYDYKKVVSYTEDIQKLKVSKAELKKSIKKIDILASNLKSQDSELKKEIRSKRVLLSHLKKQKVKYTNQLSSIRNTSDKLLISDKIDNLNELFGTDFFEQKGQLRLPVPGVVTKSFGIFKDPKFKNKIKNNGLFINSLNGSGVRNVHPGKVIFVGPMRGLGKVIIVDHGDHYYTVYGNNKNVLVSEGESLNIHHKIAEVGHSPVYNMSGTYFEIRYFSEPINPKKWIIRNNISKL